MNWDQIEGKWKQLTGSAREQWGELTSDDLATLTGQKDQLVGKIQERWSKSQQATKHESAATQ